MPTAQKTAGSSASAGTTATVPKATASGGAATMTRPANGIATQTQAAQHAFESFNQLELTVGQLGRELKSYGEPNVVGRNPILLRSFGDQVVGELWAIMKAYNIPWTPPQNVARGGRA